ncbi:TPA: hypothetical protein QCY08_005316 [Bacillus paranthracis]|nr:hypothetical protein [Bacillus paranthracis]
MLFNGLIQLFSKVTLVHLKYSLQSLVFEEERKKYAKEDWVHKFFSEEYFHRNAILFIDSAFNKIATLIKFRYEQPDEYLYVDLKRIHKMAKRDTEYKHSKIKILVDQLIGDHNYKLITESRAQLEHALDPDYISPKRLNRIIKFDKIAATVFSIIDEIFKDHLKAEIKIEDKDINYYKIKVILTVPITKSEKMDTILQNSNYYQNKSIHLLHLIGNYNDHIIPYIKGISNIKSNDKALIVAFLPILSDITFRFHEITRSFMYFLLLHYFADSDRHLGKEVCKRVKEADSTYFMYVSTFRIYSIYDKVASFLSLLYPVSKEKTYFKSISGWIIENDTTNASLKANLKEILESPSYQALDMLRQQTSHGWDLAIQQEEGTVISGEYFTLALYHNLKNIMLLIETIHNIYPTVVRNLLLLNDIKLDSFEEIIEKVFTEENEHIQELEKVFGDT